MKARGRPRKDREEPKIVEVPVEELPVVIEATNEPVWWVRFDEEGRNIPDGGTRMMTQAEGMRFPVGSPDLSTIMSYAVKMPEHIYVFKMPDGRKIQVQA